MGSLGPRFPARLEFSMHIRRAGPEDAEAIVEVVNAAWRWAYAHIMPAEQLATLESPERTERIRNSLAKNHVTYLAEEDNKIDGYASIQ